MNARRIFGVAIFGMAISVMLATTLCGQETEAVEQPNKAAASEKKAAKAREMDHFMRIGHDRRGRAVSLETSITRYETVNANNEVVTVDLIGAVHVGEKEYYEQLNEQFKKYDALLYELVAPKGTRIPKGGDREEGGLNPIAAFQLGLKSFLKLEFQLDHIDYECDNFVHADMSPEEFLESMANNDESFSKIFLKAMGQSMAMQSGNQVSSGDLLLAAFSKNPTLKFRKTMAQQMRDMEGGMAMFEGKDGSTIINHRNAKAMDVLRQEIAGGKRKIAVFYGAGHLPDMQLRLTSDFKMKRGGQFWLTAWKLVEPSKTVEK